MLKRKKGHPAGSILVLRHRYLFVKHALSSTPHPFHLSNQLHRSGGLDTRLSSGTGRHNSIDGGSVGGEKIRSAI